MLRRTKKVKTNDSNVSNKNIVTVYLILQDIIMLKKVNQIYSQGEMRQNLSMDDLFPVLFTA